MEEYLQKTRLSQRLDAVGLHFLLLMLSVGWFVLLWGLRLTALLAGGALYGLLAVILQKGRDSRLKRKEQRLRRQLGGEMALERLLLTAPEKAHFEAAVTLSLRYPLTLLRMEEAGVLCDLRGEKALVSFVQLPRKDAVTPAQVLACQRAARALGAERAILCLPCGIREDAREQAAAGPRVTFLSRERMTALFGAQAPATNDQLVALGRRKQQKTPLRHWFRRVLDRGKARRYALYGGLLLGLYLATGLLCYALPGLMCAFLAAACHCGREEEEGL